jgi:hypothetical protein
LSRSSPSSSSCHDEAAAHDHVADERMYLRATDRPKEAMKPLPNLMETELDTFGASTV